MLSIANVSGGAAQSGYYNAEGYYLEGTGEAEANSQYFGKAAEAADLIGNVEDAQFAKLLEGEAPDGKMLGRVLSDGTRQHRTGIDLTFSAPKGVSIAGLVAGDTRVIEAHTEAVKTAMAYVEEKLVQTRTKRDGEITVHTSGKIIAGLFQHDTSRALDPQLHTHAVIANMVQTEDGTFRALHNDQIYKNKMLTGQIYRNALAQNLERLGYTIERHDKGLFDIKDIPNDLIETFSKRREEILSALNARSLETTPQNSALAALATRSSKKPIERSELKAAWHKEVERAGYDLTSLRPAPLLALQNPNHDVSKAVDFAILHTAERASTYERAAVVELAMKQDFRADIGAVNAHLDHLVDAKVLFSVTLDDKAHLTDVQNVALEKSVLAEAARGEGPAEIDVRSLSEKALRRSSDGVVKRRLERTKLTEGQRDALQLGLSAEAGRVVGVQGLAGTGKTYMLQTLVKYAEKAGHEVHGIAPTHKAVEALSEAVPNARTISSAEVMAQHKGTIEPDTKSILIVDEASMVSTAQMDSVLKLANRAHYDRVVLVGDIKQLEAVGAGAPFRLLQRGGMPVATMADVQRQHTEEGRQAVLHAYAAEIKEAFSRIEPVRETDKGEDRAERRANIADGLARDYLGRSPSERAATGIVVMTNEMRGLVNDQVQAGLRDAGHLMGRGQKLDVLIPRNLSWAEAREVSSYRVNDVVTTTRDLPKEGLDAKVLYRVGRVDETARTLTLSAPDGTERTIPMGPDDKAASNLIAYKPEQQNVFAGDRVKFRITDRDNGIVNAATGTIQSVSADTLTLREESGREVMLPTDSLAVKGMQLAYASTAHGFQGASIDQVLVGLDSTEQLATQKAFYVSISRMRDATRIYTDDAARLITTIEHNTGERINALEALQRDETPRPEDRQREVVDRSEPAPSEPQKDRAEEAQKQPENPAQNEAENRAAKQAEQSPEKDSSDRTKSALENGALSARDLERLDAEFDRIVKQLENQKERGERER